jgi:hypothetical protein
MTKIERFIVLTYSDKGYYHHSYAPSDDKAILDAIHSVENKLGLIRGSLISHFKDNPNDIVCKLK